MTSDVNLEMGRHWEKELVPCPGDGIEHLTVLGAGDLSVPVDGVEDLSVLLSVSGPCFWPGPDRVVGPGHRSQKSPDSLDELMMSLVT